MKFFALVVVLMMIAVPVYAHANSTDDEGPSGNMSPETTADFGSSAVPAPSGIRAAALQAMDSSSLARNVVRARVAAAVNTSDLNTNEVRKLAAVSRARAKELAASGNISALRERLNEIKVNTIRRQSAFRQRVIDDISSMKARMEQRMDEFDRNESAFEASRGRFLEVRDRYQQCRSANDTASNSSDCAAVREQAFNHSKAALLHAADAALSQLDKIEARIESDEDLSADVAANLTSEIAGLKANISSARSDVESASTIAELKSAGAALRSSIQEARHSFRLFSLHMAKAKYQEAFVRADILEKRMERLVEIMRNRSVDVDSSKLDEFSSKLAEARQKHAEAVAAFESALVSRDSAAIAESRSLFADAHSLLTEANRILVSLAVDFRSSLSEAGISASVSETLNASTAIAELGESNEVEVEDESS